MIFGIKSLAITTPVLGRISIGKVVERNGKRLPQKDDCFTVTSQIQKKGEWIIHPLHEKLAGKGEAATKLRDIPVTVMFDDPALNMRAEFTVFDKGTGRPMCIGDGEKARRSNQAEGGAEDVPCPGPTFCEYGQKNRCKAYGRLNVQIEGQGDETATFMFRTTGFNSIRTLQARLAYFHALSSGKMAGMPLSLKLRGKSTTQSMRDAIYYVDMDVREGVSLIDAVKVAQDKHKEWEDAGMNRQALEEVARQGLLNSVFEEAGDDGELQSVLDEFFSEETADVDDDAPGGARVTGSITALHAKSATSEKPAPPAGNLTEEDDFFGKPQLQAAAA